MGYRAAVLTGMILAAWCWTAGAQPPGYTPSDDFGARRVGATPGAKEARIALAWGEQLKPPAKHTRAIINLKEAMARWTQVPVTVERQFYIGSGDFMNLPIVFILADEQFQLSETEKKNLKAYLAQGGMIVADDAGAAMPGSQSGAAIRQMIRDISGGKRLEPIPSSHTIYKSPLSVGGAPKGSDTSASKVGTNILPDGGEGRVVEKTQIAGREAANLEGIFIDGRLAVVFTSKGYSSYWSADAENDPQLRFGVNLIMYAINTK